MIRILHPFNTYPPPLIEIKHRFRVRLHPSTLFTTLLPLNQAPPFLLIRNRRPPRLIHVFLRIPLQLRHKMPHKPALGVRLFRKRNGAVAAVELGEKRRAA